MSHYEVEGHDVVVWERRSRWTTSVDHVPVPGWFVSEADAWTAGVREALRPRRALQGAQERVHEIAPT